jgi:RNA-directed DNA polymerase
LGALALRKLDAAMGRLKGVFYCRYMDDWAVLCRSRHKLRKIIKITHRVLIALKLRLHPNKTYLGKINKGIDFLGYFIHYGGLYPSPLKRRWVYHCH